MERILSHLNIPFCLYQYELLFYPLIGEDGASTLLASQIKGLKRELAQTKLELSTLKVKFTKTEDEWEEKIKQMKMDLVSLNLSSYIDLGILGQTGFSHSPKKS